MIFVYGLSYVFVWYFWVTCPSDFFLGSEGPKAAASAGSLVTLRDASLSPPTDFYNWKGSTHKHTQSCWRFKSQGIQHSTNIGLAWCSAKISIDSAMLQQSLSLSQHQRQILQQKNLLKPIRFISWWPIPTTRLLAHLIKSFNTKWEWQHGMAQEDPFKKIQDLPALKKSFGSWASKKASDVKGQITNNLAANGFKGMI